MEGASAQGPLEEMGVSSGVKTQRSFGFGSAQSVCSRSRLTVSAEAKHSSRMALFRTLQTSERTFSSQSQRSLLSWQQSLRDCGEGQVVKAAPFDEGLVAFSAKETPREAPQRHRIGDEPTAEASECARRKVSATAESESKSEPLAVELSSTSVHLDVLPGDRSWKSVTLKNASKKALCFELHARPSLTQSVDCSSKEGKTGELFYSAVQTLETASEESSSGFCCWPASGVLLPGETRRVFFGFGSCPNSSGGLFSCEWRVRLRLSSQRIFPSSKEDCFPSPCISVSAVVDAFCLQTQPPTLRLLETCHSRAVAIRNAEEILNDILEAVFSGSASEREQFESASADSLPDNKGLSEGNMADPAVTPQKHPVLADRELALLFEKRNSLYALRAPPRTVEAFLRLRFEVENLLSESQQMLQLQRRLATLSVVPGRRFCLSTTLKEITEKRQREAPAAAASRSGRFVVWRDDSCFSGEDNALAVCEPPTPEESLTTNSDVLEVALAVEEAVEAAGEEQAGFVGKSFFDVAALKERLLALGSEEVSVHPALDWQYRRLLFDCHQSKRKSPGASRQSASYESAERLLESKLVVAFDTFCSALPEALEGAGVSSPWSLVANDDETSDKRGSGAASSVSSHRPSRKGLSKPRNETRSPGGAPGDSGNGAVAALVAAQAVAEATAAAGAGLDSTELSFAVVAETLLSILLTDAVAAAEAPLFEAEIALSLPPQKPSKEQLPGEKAATPDLPFCIAEALPESLDFRLRLLADLLVKKTSSQVASTGGMAVVFLNGAFFEALLFEFSKILQSEGGEEADIRQRALVSLLRKKLRFVVEDVLQFHSRGVLLCLELAPELDYGASASSSELLQQFVELALEPALVSVSASDEDEEAEAPPVLLLTPDSTLVFVEEAAAEGGFFGWEEGGGQTAGSSSAGGVGDEGGGEAVDRCVFVVSSWRSFFFHATRTLCRLQRNFYLENDTSSIAPSPSSAHAAAEAFEEEEAREKQGQDRDAEEAATQAVGNPLAAERTLNQLSQILDLKTFLLDDAQLSQERQRKNKVDASFPALALDASPQSRAEASSSAQPAESAVNASSSLSSSFEVETVAAASALACNPWLLSVSVDRLLGAEVSQLVFAAALFWGVDSKALRLRALAAVVDAKAEKTKLRSLPCAVEVAARRVSRILPCMKASSRCSLNGLAEPKEASAGRSKGGEEAAFISPCKNQRLEAESRREGGPLASPGEEAAVCVVLAESWEGAAESSGSWDSSVSASLFVQWVARQLRRLRLVVEEGVCSQVFLAGDLPLLLCGCACGGGLSLSTQTRAAAPSEEAVGEVSGQTEESIQNAEFPTAAPRDVCREASKAAAASAAMAAKSLPLSASGEESASSEGSSRRGWVFFESEKTLGEDAPEVARQTPSPIHPLLPHPLEELSPQQLQDLRTLLLRSMTGILKIGESDSCLLHEKATRPTAFCLSRRAPFSDLAEKCACNSAASRGVSVEAPEEVILRVDPSVLFHSTTAGAVSPSGDTALDKRRLSDAGNAAQGAKNAGGGGSNVKAAVKKTPKGKGTGKGEALETQGETAGAATESPAGGSAAEALALQAEFITCHIPPSALLWEVLTIKASYISACETESLASSPTQSTPESQRAGTTAISATVPSRALENTRGPQLQQKRKLKAEFVGIGPSSLSALLKALEESNTVLWVGQGLTRGQQRQTQQSEAPNCGNETELEKAEATELILRTLAVRNTELSLSYSNASIPGGLVSTQNVDSTGANSSQSSEAMSDLDETSEIYSPPIGNSEGHSNPATCGGPPQFIVLVGPIVRIALTCPAVVAAAGADSRDSGSVKESSTAEFVLIFDDAPLWKILEGWRLKDPLLADDLSPDFEPDFSTIV